MPRRAMLPYPSTSRRLCSAARCPRVTTVALVSILLTCLYHSRRILSKDQPTLSRVVDPGSPHTALEPAVEVVKEVTDKADTGFLGFGKRETSTGAHPVSNNIASLAPENKATVLDDRRSDADPVSVTDLESNTGQKDLVGYIADAQKEQANLAESENASSDTASDVVPVADPVEHIEDQTSDLVSGLVPTVGKPQEEIASGAKAVERTEDQAAEVVSGDIPTAEKTEEESAGDTVPTVVGSSTEGIEIDSAERTDNADSATSTEVVDGEIPPADKQEDLEETSTTTETAGSQVGATEVEGEVLAVEKQESTDDATDTDDDGDGIGSEVLTVQKQESADGLGVTSVDGETPADREAAVSLIDTVEKDVAEKEEMGGVETVEKQEADQEVRAEDVADTAERAKADAAPMAESEVHGQELVDDGLDAADKQDATKSETATEEEIADSEKQEESAGEKVDGTDVTAVEKQSEVESDHPVLQESERESTEAEDGEKIEAVDGDAVVQLSSAEKMTDEESDENEN